MVMRDVVLNNAPNEERGNRDDLEANQSVAQE